MFEFSFGNFLYDNSLEKPCFGVGNGREKKQYPGFDALIQSLKNSSFEIKIEGNRFDVGSKSYMVRYDGKGTWTFGNVDNDVDIIFAISKLLCYSRLS